jgi:uncharacterized protein (DUF58 family)
MSFADSFPEFRLGFTRWGGVFLVALLALGFAAVNTGNNALMALLGFALGSYAVSGAWSRQILGKVEARVMVPGELYAGRPEMVEIELTNRSRILPAYGLVVRDTGGKALIFEPLLLSSSSRRYSVELVCEARGWQQIGPWRLEVLLPLGFFVKSKRLAKSRRVLVYPRLLKTSTASIKVAGGRRSADRLDDRGREGEVVQLRDYDESDDRRQLHWKQTARQQRPIVVDRQRRSEQPVFFTLDSRVADPSDPGTRRRFEDLVSDVATGAVRRIESGVPVGLVVDRVVINPVRSSARVGRLLGPLAEVQPRPPDADPPTRIGGGAEFVFRLENPQ